MKISRPAGSSSQVRAPSDGEVIFLALAASIALAVTLEVVDPESGYWGYANGAGDTFTYLQITDAIRRNDLAGLDEVMHFWGVAYLAAALASLTTLSNQAALLVVSGVGSIASVVLARRLWGGWIAAFFGLISWDWLQASVLGGSETVFVALVFASFLAAREERWVFAALAASSSALVRPLGVFALAAVVAVPAWRGEARRAVIAASIGIAIIGVYLVPLAVARGDVLAHFHAYQTAWIGGRPVGVPFAGFVRGIRIAPTTFTLLRPAVWVALVFAGISAFALRKEAREYLRHRPVETVFAVLYVSFLFTYNSNRWAWSEFPRFMIPLIPFALLALDPWLIKNRILLRVLAPSSGALAAGWVIGFHHAWSLLRGAT